MDRMDWVKWDEVVKGYPEEFKVHQIVVQKLEGDELSAAIGWIRNYAHIEGFEPHTRVILDMSNDEGDHYTAVHLIDANDLCPGDMPYQEWNADEKPFNVVCAGTAPKGWASV